MSNNISEKQLAANRKNAKKSSGPRTTEGKDRVRENALKHGLTAERIIFRDESAEGFDAFKEDLFNQLAPEGTLEGQLAERAATLIWRLKRAPVFEAALYQWTEHYEQAQTVCDPKPIELKPRSLSKVAFAAKMAASNGDEELADEERERLLELEVGRTLDGMFSSGVFDKVTRYETKLQRQLREVLKGLAELQESRFNREKV